MTDTEKAEHEPLIRLLTEKLRETVDENDRLRAENEQLTSTLDAHGFLQSVWRDSTQPVTARVRAAQAALNVEKAPLKPQPPPLDLTVVPSEQLAVTVEKQRARMVQIHALPIEQRAELIAGVVRNDGNGADDSDDELFGLRR